MESWSNWQRRPPDEGARQRCQVKYPDQTTGFVEIRPQHPTKLISAG